MAEENSKKTKHHRGVLVIAFFKLFKGVLLLLVGLSAISLIGKNVSEVADRIMHWLHWDPNGKLFYTVLEKFSTVDDHRLRQVSAATFFYSALMLTEGVGLIMEKRWAEWLTIFVTASFIPFEIYEMTKHLTPTKIIILVINVAIVAYLIHRLREKRDA